MAANSGEINSAPPTEGVREDMIQTAVKFLQNPKVINTPLAQKQKFLQRKGLTDAEIQKACERSGAYIHHEQINSQPSNIPPPALAPMPYGYNYGYMQLTWFERLREIANSIAIFSIVAYVIHKFYEKYIAPFLFGKKKKNVDESIQDLDKELKTSVQKLSKDIENVKIEIDRLNQSSEITTNRELCTIKSDISTVKGLLLSRKQFPSVANTPVVPPSIPAWQMSSVQSSDEHDHDVDHEDSAGKNEDLMEMGSGSGSSEPEHYTKTSESSLEIIYNPRDFDSESCHSRKSKEDVDKD